MTKDEQIAFLNQQVAYLRERLDKAEARADKADIELNRLRTAARDRQASRRRRVRLALLQSLTNKASDWECHYCGLPLTLETATIDHFIPRAQGGRDDPGNLVVACTDCNEVKNARTPEQAQPFLDAIRQSRLQSTHGHVTVQTTPIECLDPSSLEENDLPVIEQKGKETLRGRNGKTAHGHVTFDRERAEEDAGRRGLVDDAFEAELQRFTDYWDSQGWKRKNGPIKDRNAAWRSWLDSPYRQTAPSVKAKGNGIDYSGLNAWSRDHGLAPFESTVLEGVLA
ncbi:MAG: HNH endonuclease [Patescibacteria group bacterium]|nr:HNH endonuclease [Patescibacteria group bacterium]